ncbi:phenylalanine--tRNA ligase subunit beta [Candidatus Peregrinibacteria bacterium]|nr:phenylalanine--tRNA ligase subunit beta [Candidatus Peregrinibacteria bacterium]
MKISVNWLKNYVNIDSQTDWKAFEELLTIRTAEVEEIIDLAGSFDQMVIGKIESISAHPDADKLRVTKTNVGSETLQIVCGASNIFEGQTVAVALSGSQVRWHGEGDLVELKPTKIRGVESNGMICAASEIGLKDEVDGILDLSHLNLKPGTPLAEALNKNDIIIDIENKTLTHRPDLWGHYGIAREIAAITDEKLKAPAFHTKYDQKLPIVIPVTVENPEACPRYLTLTIEGIEVGPSPDWLRTALENTGNRSINNIVDATNFVMLELGNPLHAFDTNKIAGGKIIVRQAKKAEKIETLDNESKELDPGMLIIADAEKPLAIAGIKGGLHSGISHETTSITLEAANFNPISTRKTSTKLGIRTEAVQRFEKDLDPLLAEQALDRLVKIILDLCPNARIVSRKQDINNFTYKPRKVKLDLSRTSQKIGVEITPKLAKELLEKLEFEVTLPKTKSSTTIEVAIPSFRATKDINHQDDLVEEIARLYGYEKIPATLPEVAIRPARPNTERREKHLIRDVFSLELGFKECVNYSFYSLKTLQKAGLNEADHLKIRNYLSEEQTHLRTSLIPNLLHSAHENLKHFDSFNLYEIGRSYRNIQQYFPLEEKHLAGLVLLPKKDRQEPFYLAKSALNLLLRRLQITSLQYQRASNPDQNPLAHPNKSAVWINPRTKQPLIELFSLHPAIAANFDLDKYQVACFNLHYTELHALPRAELRYRSIPRFPAIEFDISAIVDAEKEVAEFEKSIRKADQNLIHNVELFDFYQGSNIPEGKKSLAYRITLQAPDRTLTDADMKQIQEKILTNLQALGAEIRG